MQTREGDLWTTVDLHPKTVRGYGLASIALQHFKIKTNSYVGKHLRKTAENGSNTLGPGELEVCC